ncbi:dicarboxylate/amino acid:cation symporter [Endozoicomonas ascidiicola]|uniref:dicarboxylate/amino acid:cation symporter n=1 Tax=Endozoicomonas ascidiicola TaxID=1698521 RepID=UPI000B2640CA|nr:dicarboxylate/amino acid:cation symporter [Endozoicomonas ascidiicola]
MQKNPCRSGRTFLFLNGSLFTGNSVLIFAGLLGIFTGWLHLPEFYQASQIVSDLFIRMLKLISLPVIFFSLVSTLSGGGDISTVKKMGSSVLKYTLVTTIIAATIALGLYLLIDPLGLSLSRQTDQFMQETSVNLWTHFDKVIPSSFIEPFQTHNVMSMLFLALLFSFSVICLEPKHRSNLNAFYDSMFAAVMKMTSFVLKLMPLAVWSFVNLFVQDLHGQEVLTELALYLACILVANVIQAGVVLPVFLKSKGFSPWQTARVMWPALTIAFFGKSSVAALPSSVECAEKLGVQSNVARFSLPICTTINMNACAAFILITVLFVAQSSGVAFSTFEMVVWIGIATVAAIGNAGVPMGCYMMSSAFLAAMGVPLQLLVIILPFYALIDMFESAVNVWSDACVTVMVNKELQEELVEEFVEKSGMVANKEATQESL